MPTTPQSDAGCRIDRDGLDAHVGSARVVVLAQTATDRVGVAPRDHRVDERVVAVLDLLLGVVIADSVRATVLDVAVRGQPLVIHSHVFDVAIGLWILRIDDQDSLPE